MDFFDDIANYFDQETASRIMTYMDCMETMEVEYEV